MVKMLDYRAEFLEQIAKLDYLSYDIGLEESELRANGTNIRVAVETNGPRDLPVVVGYYYAVAAAEMCRIVRLAVAPALRRRYIGEMLFEDIGIRHYACSSVVCSVDEYNLAGQLFLKSCKMRGTIIRKGQIFFEGTL